LGLGRSNSGGGSPQHIRTLSAIPVVQISVGGEHSFALSASGCVFGWGRNDCGQLGLGDTEVFTFGSGRYGQLGHNSFRDELRPRLVAELLGAKVTKIACGRYHTLVLTDPMKVYSFGCNDHQQLGRENESQSSIPLPVQLPLWFLTGFRKVPVTGMGQIRMRIQILSGSHDQHFPESLTCHSILRLPVYSTKEIMRKRLTEALKPERGFRD
ncbi:hypothetical protein GOODEAATRI_003909, partial [Goodea atripinnis]